jgi:hypothetical protein
MLIDFTVPRRTQGLVALLNADRFDSDDADGADAGGGAADGSQPLDEDAPIDQDSEAVDAGDDESTRRAAADEGGDPDEDEDDNDRYEGLPHEERVKKLLAARKRDRRRLRERTPVFQRVQELAKHGISIDDLIQGFRSARAYEGLAQRNPKLRALLNGGDGDAEERTDRSRGDRRSATDDFQFDDSPEALGFDPKASQANKSLAASMRQTALLNHQFQKLMARLDPDKLLERVDGIERGVQHQSATAIRREWTEAIDAAMPHIKDPDLRDVFQDLMTQAMEKAGGKRPAKGIVEFYLKKLKINPAQAAKATTAAAAASRIRHGAAERVTQLQRQPGRQGTAAPARQGKETLAQVHRRVRTAGGPQVR